MFRREETKLSLYTSKTSLISYRTTHWP